MGACERPSYPKVASTGMQLALDLRVDHGAVAEHYAELKEELGISVQAAELHWGDVQEPWARLAPIVALARAFRERTESRPERMGLIGRIMAEPHHMLPREEGERVIADAVGLRETLVGMGILVAVIATVSAVLRLRQAPRPAATL